MKELLNDGLQQLGVEIPCERFLHYLNLLQKWNQAYNLTAVRDMPSMITKHLLDSLAIIPWVKGPRVLDVGSGGGLPGIPLALANPDLQVVLLDSNGKKTRFLQAAKRELGLANVEVVQSRVEDFHPKQRFDTVVSRAFSNLLQMLTWTEHLVDDSGIWLAMKGVYPEDELAEVTYPYQVKTYTFAGLDAARCCIIVLNTKKESPWQKS